jgi:hypothetical protein
MMDMQVQLRKGEHVLDSAFGASLQRLPDVVHRARVAALNDWQLPRDQRLTSPIELRHH